MARLFIALWPDAGVRAALAAVQGACRPARGRPVPVGNLHLTLAFLGETDAAGRACAEEAARRAAAAVDLCIDTTGGFAGARVVWAGPRSVPPALTEVHAALWHGLADACGRVAEARPFHPHVTLWRDVPAVPAPARCTPVRWCTNELYLVESIVDRHGARYRPLEAFRAPTAAE